MQAQTALVPDTTHDLPPLRALPVKSEPDLRLPSSGAPEVRMRHHVANYRKAGAYFPEYKIVKTEPDSNRNWLNLLKHGELSMQDTTVEWPRFLKFCVNVYNWGDRFFNGFDTTYVVGTGRRWKVRLVTDLWTDSYLLKFSKHKPIVMTTDPVVHTGLYLQYMAVSIGYAVDIGNVIFNRPISNNKFNFGFSCGLFSADFTYVSNTGGTHLRRFGENPEHKNIHVYFPGLKMNTVDTDIIFFLNHRKYSQVAAYSFGRIQKRRAGTAILGYSYSSQNIDMDFNQLPADFIEKVPPAERQLNFRYRNYNFLAGYAYNWPVGKHLLFNVTAYPALGVSFSDRTIGEGKHTMFSLGVRGQAAVVYNHKDFFAGLNGKVMGQFYYSHASQLFSMIEYGTLTLGVRF